MYYAKYKKSMISNENSYRIQSFDIDMKCFRTLKVDLSIGVKALKPVKKLEMTMYRDLIITSIESEGKVLSFDQTGDLVTINLSEVLGKDDTIEIRLQYEGKTSPFFYANERAVMLPAYYAWIPREGNFQIMDRGYGYSSNKAHEAHYKLQYSGPSTLFTNLPSTGKNLWEGTTKDGITLVASDYMGVTEIQDIKIAYPLSLYKSIGEVKRIIDSEKLSRKVVASDFNKEYDSSDSKLIFILTAPNIGLGGSAIHKFSDHTIIETGSEDLNINSLNIANRNFNSLCNLLNAEYNTNNQITMPFKAGYEYWYAVRFTPELVNESSMMRNGIDPNFDYDMFYITLKSKVDSNINNEELLRELFRKLLQAVQQNNKDEFKILLGL